MFLIFFFFFLFYSCHFCHLFKINIHIKFNNKSAMETKSNDPWCSWTLNFIQGSGTISIPFLDTLSLILLSVVPLCGHCCYYTQQISQMNDPHAVSALFSHWNNCHCWNMLWCWMWRDLFDLMLLWSTSLFICCFRGTTTLPGTYKVSESGFKTYHAICIILQNVSSLLKVIKTPIFPETTWKTWPLCLWW